nr:MAG TPA: hypothetical protein [Caudoviricetes sp.]DAU84667.1 MAG TPA: hypothetical protein [Caudoviricetes sp.]
MIVNYHAQNISVIVYYWCVYSRIIYTKNLL